MILGKTKLYRFWKNCFATTLKRRRMKNILKMAGLPETCCSVLEIGCANGKDVVQFLKDKRKYELTGLDLKDDAICQENFRFVKGDAQTLPFADKSFDLVVSVGLLEHIEPVEKLCRVIREIDRVGKSYVCVVPSISSLIEPHCGSVRFPCRLHKNQIDQYQVTPLRINYFSEHTWSKFLGFRECDIKRKFYVFSFIKNTFIYKKYPAKKGSGRLGNRSKTALK